MSWVQNCRSPFLGYEDELIPGGGPAILSLQKERTAIEICWQIEHPHTRTIHTIPSGVFNPLAKLTSRMPSIQAAAVDPIYLAHANALRKAGRAPSVSPTMGELWEKQDEKLEKNKERDVSVKKNRNVYFCVAYSR